MGRLALGIPTRSPQCSTGPLLQSVPDWGSAKVHGRRASWAPEMTWGSVKERLGLGFLWSLSCTQSDHYIGSLKSMEYLIHFRSFCKIFSQ